MPVSDLPVDQTPGAMAVRLERWLPDGGVIQFESAPAGFLSKNGKPRVQDWRRYFYTPPSGDKRSVYPSVTTICSAVLPKDGLPPWAETQGIMGAVEALRRGLIGPETPPADAVKIVRANRLGADAARDTAADRGLNVHAILEAYMNTGQVPNPAEHPEPHRPFIQGLARWLQAVQPEPVAVELLVCDPDRGYAGRLDLLATINGVLTLVDLKTSPNGAIYDAAHLQVELLRRAEAEHGEHAPERMLLVAVDASGNYRESGCIAPTTLAERALAFYADIKGLTGACEQANRIQREATRA